MILITEKYFTGKILAKLPEAVQTLYTMILVMLGWVLFFSPTLGSALTWIGNMFGQGATGFDGQPGIVPDHAKLALLGGRDHRKYTVYASARKAAGI